MAAINMHRVQQTEPPRLQPMSPGRLPYGLTPLADRDAGRYEHPYHHWPEKEGLCCRSNRRAKLAPPAFQERAQRQRASSGAHSGRYQEPWRGR
ncbi:hypothetical protein BC938DRAFT_484236 [Jimgerdemannia flammicorona]|uniref:Uncharacterized protein n=1 Tax=Jimgerdemannia flammicorona TaxID=994334 RepID=A0A433QVG3_9FUNG|nr:hypothetical protein BC938DRAFT_484236 [Jimgerdemannia flammicorona]